ncbi:MAG: tetratricopeptide repeat protein [Planctomycetes bacterium]|nr:tetratricopeptide repeat protein [Planctomycetota bacterium]
MRRLFFTFLCFLMSSTMSASRADEIEDAIRKVQVSLKKGDNEAALKAADEAVKLAPKNAMAWYFRGEVNGRLRKPDEAIKDFEKAMSLDEKLIAATNQRGGEQFKLGKIDESIKDFEAYIKANPKGYDDHWRYGISLYYAKRFAEGAKQFKAGEKAFGNDVENAFWHYLCNARVDGVKKARETILVVGPDARVPMMKVYDLIKGKATAEEVIKTAQEAKLDAEDKNEALFYAHLYVGLNFEAEGDLKKSQEHLKTAVEKHKISHYMWDVGNVHLKLLSKK